MFDPKGYDRTTGSSAGPYDKWAKHMDEEGLRNTQARYAAQVVLTDRWLEKLLDKMDEHNLWENTVLFSPAITARLMAIMRDWERCKRIYTTPLGTFLSSWRIHNLATANAAINWCN